MSVNPFTGTWKLLSYEVRSNEGKITYPWGKDLAGQIMYSKDGYMSVAMMAMDRPNFTDSRDVSKGTGEEKTAAIDRYLSYAGRYDIVEKESKIYHHLRISLFPNWVNGDQIRNYKFEGNKLYLSTDPAPGDEKKKTGHLIWERI
ncbi:MAG: lipocalin-like domain-containing protein [Chloroflexi bacterium]|nr:lipocalin-like domain-containing protein [Chloroflexota bacterium]